LHIIFIIIEEKLSSNLLSRSYLSSHKSMTTINHSLSSGNLCVNICKRLETVLALIKIVSP